MSANVSGWVWRNASVKSGELVVLLALADNAHDDGTGAFPSQEHLAKKARMTDRQVRNCLRSLEGQGLIRREGALSSGITIWAVQMGAENFSGWKPGSGEPGNGLPTEPSVEPSEAVEPYGSTALHEQTPLASGEIKGNGPPSSKRSGCARGDEHEMPLGFPDELRPHGRAVLVVLRDVAERKGGKAVTPRALAHVLMAHPHHALVREAHALAAWAEGKSRVRDVVATYRNWLGRSEELAATEKPPGTRPDANNGLRMPQGDRGNDAILRDLGVFDG